MLSFVGQNIWTVYKKKKQERDKLQWNKDEEEIKHQSIIEPL